MQNKLLKFNEFADSLFPHEVDYLLSVQNFQSDDNLKILKIIDFNIKGNSKKVSFDKDVDKRKYSYVKKWIDDNLKRIDVDYYYENLIYLEKKIMTDTIEPEDEKKILKFIKQTENKHYYFIRFYEVLEYYRDYLLIRVRNQFYIPVSEYLETNEAFYNNVTEINKNINKATVDIINQHSLSDRESSHWEEVLNNIFLDETLDGYTRYRAAVRLTFLYYNYNEFEKLKLMNNHLDALFKTGMFYSRRILANYYANRAMMHLKLKEYSEAEKYGYWAIKEHNSDFLLYLVNLCGVLLKRGKTVDAYKIMSNYIPELSKTNSIYYKIGFMSYYIKTLLANNLVDKAVKKAESFLSIYKKEIIKQRWHIFFSQYVRSLYKAEQFSKLTFVIKKYNLINKEKANVGKARYLPVMMWYYAVSEYMNGNCSENKLQDEIIKSIEVLQSYKYKESKYIELLNEFSNSIPRIVKKITDKIT